MNYFKQISFKQSNLVYLAKGEAPQTISAEAQKALIDKTATPVDPVAFNYINDRIQRISQGDPAAKAKIIKYVEASIMGRQGATNILSFDRSGVEKIETFKNGEKNTDFGKQVLNWPEFKEYCRHLDQVLVQIVAGTIEVGKSSGTEVAVLSKYPEMKGLLDKGVDIKTIGARVKIINDLEKVKREFLSQRDNVTMVIRGSAYEKERENINATIKNLKTLTPEQLKVETIDTTIKNSRDATVWNTGNLEIKKWGTDTISCEEYISRILGSSRLAHQAVAAKKPENVKTSNESTQTAEMVDRLRKFVDIFEGSHKDPKYKPILSRVQELLDAGDQNSVNLAVEELNKILKKDFKNIDASNIALSEKGLATVLRGVGDTANSGEIMAKEGTKEITDEGVKAEIQKIMNANKDKAASFAQRKYIEIRDQLADDPVAEEQFRSQPPDQVMKMLSTIYLEKNAITDYIKTNGSNALPGILQMYDDMKGLHGRWNWSDENVKLAKEMAVTVAAMIATAIATGGVSLIVGTIGRMALATAGTIRFVKAVKTGVKVEQAADKARKLAKIKKAGDAAQAVLESSKLARFMTNTVAFSGFQTEFAKLADDIGGPSGGEVRTFFDNLATNAKMFAAFEGAGVLSKGIISKLKLEKLPKALAATGKFSVEIAGDMTAMYALYLIETGKVEMTKEELIKMGVTAIAYRVGIKEFGKLMPKISAKLGGDFSKSGKPEGGKPEASTESPRTEPATTRGEPVRTGGETVRVETEAFMVDGQPLHVGDSIAFPNGGGRYVYKGRGKNGTLEFRRDGAKQGTKTVTEAEFAKMNVKGDTIKPRVDAQAKAEPVATPDAAKVEVDVFKVEGRPLQIGDSILLPGKGRFEYAGKNENGSLKFKKGGASPKSITVTEGEFAKMNVKGETIKPRVNAQAEPVAAPEAAKVEVKNWETGDVLQRELADAKKIESPTKQARKYSDITAECNEHVVDCKYRIKMRQRAEEAFKNGKKQADGAVMDEKLGTIRYDAKTDTYELTSEPSPSGKIRIERFENVETTKAKMKKMEEMGETARAEVANLKVNDGYLRELKETNITRVKEAMATAKNRLEQLKAELKAVKKGRGADLTLRKQPGESWDQAATRARKNRIKLIEDQIEYRKTEIGKLKGELSMWEKTSIESLRQATEKPVEAAKADAQAKAGTAPAIEKVALSRQALEKVNSFLLRAKKFLQTPIKIEGLSAKIKEAIHKGAESPELKGLPPRPLVQKFLAQLKIKHPNLTKATAALAAVAVACSVFQNDSQVAEASAEAVKVADKEFSSDETGVTLPDLQMRMSLDEGVRSGKVKELFDKNKEYKSKSGNWRDINKEFYKIFVDPNYAGKGDAKEVKDFVTKIQQEVGIKGTNADGKIGPMTMGALKERYKLGDDFEAKFV